MSTTCAKQDDNSLSGVGLTCLTAIQVDLAAFGPVVDRSKFEAARRVASFANGIRTNIRSYEALFNSRGYKCPLSSQFDRTLVGGLPTIFPAIDMLLAIEMSYGVLAGIQDLAKTCGAIRMELASGDESFAGMRSKIKCRLGEVIVRDDAGVIASLFQGPDRRTMLTPTSSDFLVLVFSAPTTSSRMITEAVDALRRALEQCSRQCSVQMQTL